MLSGIPVSGIGRSCVLFRFFRTQRVASHACDTRASEKKREPNPSVSTKLCFWGRCPGCNPPSVLSSICLIGENPRLQRRIIGVYCPFHTATGTNVSSSIQSLHQPFSREGESIIVTRDQRGIVSAPPHRLSPGTSYGTQRSPPCGWSFLKITTMIL